MDKERQLDIVFLNYGVTQYELARAMNELQITQSAEFQTMMNEFKTKLSQL